MAEQELFRRYSLPAAPTRSKFRSSPTSTTAADIGDDSDRERELTMEVQRRHRRDRTRESISSKSRSRSSETRVQGQAEKDKPADVPPKAEPTELLATSAQYRKEKRSKERDSSRVKERGQERERERKHRTKAEKEEIRDRRRSRTESILISIDDPKPEPPTTNVLSFLDEDQSDTAAVQAEDQISPAPALEAKSEKANEAVAEAERVPPQESQVTEPPEATQTASPTESTVPSEPTSSQASHKPVLHRNSDSVGSNSSTTTIKGPSTSNKSPTTLPDLNSIFSEPSSDVVVHKAVPPGGLPTPPSDSPQATETPPQGAWVPDRESRHQRRRSRASPSERRRSLSKSLTYGRTIEEEDTSASHVGQYTGRQEMSTSYRPYEYGQPPYGYDSRQNGLHPGHSYAYPPPRIDYEGAYGPDGQINGYPASFPSPADERLLDPFGTPNERSGVTYYPGDYARRRRRRSSMSVGLNRDYYELVDKSEKVRGEEVEEEGSVPSEGISELNHGGVTLDDEAKKDTKEQSTSPSKLQDEKPADPLNVASDREEPEMEDKKNLKVEGRNSPSVQSEAIGSSSGIAGSDTGYPLLADTLSSHPELQVYRRFSRLNNRVLLHMQDEIMELEELLRAMDAAADSEDGGIRERRGMMSTMKGEKRLQILGAISWKLQQYNQALKYYNHTLSLQEPEKAEFDAYVEFLKEKNPLGDAESRFLDDSKDTVVLGKLQPIKAVSAATTPPIPTPVAHYPPPLNPVSSPPSRPLSRVSQPASLASQSVSVTQQYLANATISAAIISILSVLVLLLLPRHEPAPAPVNVTHVPVEHTPRNPYISLLAWIMCLSPAVVNLANCRQWNTTQYCLLGSAIFGAFGATYFTLSG